MVCRNSNGIYEGVAIGGDRYPGSRFIDHMLRYQDDPKAKFLLLLGEVGGTDEYEVIEAVKSGRITKPMIAWCVGTCASASRRRSSSATRARRHAATWRRPPPRTRR